MTTIVEGSSILLGGPSGRYPYDGDGNNIVWPVLKSDFKSHAQITHDLDDGIIQSDDFAGYLADATEEIEARGQVSLIYQKRRQVLNRLPSEESVSIIRGPLVSVTEIGYLDEDDVAQVLDLSLYRANDKSRRGSIYFKDTSSLTVADGDGSVWIDVVCGYGIASSAVSAQWRQCVAIVATHSYERRELVSGGGLDEAMERVINRKVIAAGATRRYV